MVYKSSNDCQLRNIGEKMKNFIKIVSIIICSHILYGNTLTHESTEEYISSSSDGYLSTDKFLKNYNIHYKSYKKSMGNERDGYVYYVLNYPYVKDKGNLKLKSIINNVVSDYMMQISKKKEITNIESFFSGNQTEYTEYINIWVVSITSATISFYIMEENLGIGSASNNFTYLTYSLEDGSLLSLDNILKKNFKAFVEKKIKLDFKTEATCYKDFAIFERGLEIKCYPNAEKNDMELGWFFEYKNILTFLKKKSVISHLYQEQSTMVIVKKGTFLMGTDKNDSHGMKPAHRVNIEYDFEVGKKKISMKEYLKFVQDTNSNHINWEQLRNNIDGEGGGLELFTLKKLEKTILETYETAIGVTWDNAKAYINWLNKKTKQKYRLLSEVEWEYIVKTGFSEMIFDRALPPEERDKVELNKYEIMGLHSGTEWCEDSYVPPPTDGSANLYTKTSNNLKVIRGGMGNDHVVDLMDRMEANKSSFSHLDLGFRLARTLDNKENKK